MIDYTYFSDKRLIITVFRGCVSVRELNDLIDKLVAIEESNGAMRGLTILCENAEMAAITYHDIFAAGKRMSRARFRVNGKNAIIAYTAPWYGMASVYQVAAEMMALEKTKVFSGDEGLAEAISWLELDNNMADEIQGLVAQ